MASWQAKIKVLRQPQTGEKPTSTYTNIMTEKHWNTTVFLKLGGGFTILALKKNAHIIQQLCLGLRNFVHFNMLYFFQGLPEAHFPLQDLQCPQSKKFMCLILEEVEMARSEAFVASQQQRVDKINTTNDRHPHLMKIRTRFNFHSWPNLGSLVLIFDFGTQ
jgi:hypothetical protein